MFEVGRKIIFTPEGEIIECESDIGLPSHSYTCEVYDLDDDKVNKYNYGKSYSLCWDHGVKNLYCKHEYFKPTIQQIDILEKYIKEKMQEEFAPDRIEDRWDSSEVALTEVEVRDKQLQQEATVRLIEETNNYEKYWNHFDDKVNAICNILELPDEYRNQDKLVRLIKSLNGYKGTSIRFVSTGYLGKWNQVHINFRAFPVVEPVGCGLEEEYEDILLWSFLSLLVFQKKKHIGWKIPMIKEDVKHKMYV